MEAAIAWIHRYDYFAIFSLLMLGIVGLPIPDETLLLYVGYLSFKGDLSAPLSLVSAAMGSASGITISYSFGRLFGPRVPTTLGSWLHLNETRYIAAQRWVSRWGQYALLIAYFVPGLRHLSAIAVGASGLRYPTFATYAYTGAVVWSATFITTGYVLGEEWVASSAKLHQMFRWIGVSVLLVVGGTIGMMLRRPAAKHSPR